MEQVETIRAQAGDTATSLQGDPAAPGLTRMAFLFGQYPAASYPFQVAEIAGLRMRGLFLETASLRRPGTPLSQLSHLDAQQMRHTHYVQDGKPLRSMCLLVGILATSPLAILRGLRAVLQVPGRRLGELGPFLFYLAEALLLGRWMRLCQLEHLHVSSGTLEATVGMLAATAWQIPFSITIHGPEELLDSSRYHLKAKLTQARFVLCVSDFCRSQLFALAPPVEWHKMYVAPMGVDPLVLTSPTRAISGSTNPRGGALKLVSTGRMVAAKGHRILLEALALLQERGVQVHTTFIGGGPELGAMRRLAQKLDLASSVIFTGALPHTLTLDHLRRADLFASLSFTEGFPVGLMEAMSLGLACVGTTVAGITELLRSGKDGLLVAPANAEAVAAALETLIHDPVSRRNMGASARQRIIGKYNLALNQEIVAEIFRNHLLPVR